jgi:hypothetical protein
MRQRGAYTFKILSPTLTHGLNVTARPKIPVYGNSESALALPHRPAERDK